MMRLKRQQQSFCLVTKWLLQVVGLYVRFSRTAASVMTARSDECSSQINSQQIMNTHHFPLFSRLQFRPHSIRLSSNQLIYSIVKSDSFYGIVEILIGISLCFFRNFPLVFIFFFFLLKVVTKWRASLKASVPLVSVLSAISLVKIRDSMDYGSVFHHRF